MINNMSITKVGELIDPPSQPIVKKHAEPMHNQIYAKSTHNPRTKTQNSKRLPVLEGAEECTAENSYFIKGGNLYP